jgi:hypothetical protein
MEFKSQNFCQLHNKSELKKIIAEKQEKLRLPESFVTLTVLLDV